MLRRLTFVVAAVIVGLALADGVARAQQGRVYTDELSRDREWTPFELEVINNLALRKGQIDSTGAIPTAGWRDITAWLYATCTGVGSGGNCDSVAFATYAVSVSFNNHAALSDTITKHPQATVRPGRGGALAAAAESDTIGKFVAWAVFDSLVSRADPVTEILVIADVSQARRFAGPYGYEIPIPGGGNYMDIRIRALDVYNQAGVVLRSASPDNATRVRIDVRGRR